MIQEILTYIIVVFASAFVIYKIGKSIYKVIVKNESGCSSCTTGSSACSSCSSGSCNGCPFATNFSFDDYKQESNNK